jgi:hypothetical protein
MGHPTLVAADPRDDGGDQADGRFSEHRMMLAFANGFTSRRSRVSRLPRPTSSRQETRRTDMTETYKAQRSSGPHRSRRPAATQLVLVAVTRTAVHDGK